MTAPSTVKTTSGSNTNEALVLQVTLVGDCRIHERSGRLELPGAGALSSALAWQTVRAAAPLPDPAPGAVEVPKLGL